MYQKMKKVMMITKTVSSAGSLLQKSTHMPIIAAMLLQFCKTVFHFLRGPDFKHQATLKLQLDV